MNQSNMDQTQQLILLNASEDLLALLQLAVGVIPTAELPYVVVDLDGACCKTTVVPREAAPQCPSEYGLCAEHLTASGYFVKNGTYVEYVPFVEDFASVVKEIQYFPKWLTQTVCRRLFTSTASTRTEELDDGRISVRYIRHFV